MFNNFLDSKVEKNRTEAGQKNPDDIAVIGMNCSFPGCQDTALFWKSLVRGKDHISNFPGTRRKDTDILLDNPLYARRKYYDAAFFEHIDYFDHDFFKLSYREAIYMDPNQKMFLQCAWGALEDAGYSSGSLAGSMTGVFLGFNNDFDMEYKHYVQQVNPDLRHELSAPGNIQSIIASRIAYILNLKGPSLVVDTACSSCLTALHLACTSLRNLECTMALAGGVKIRLLPLREEDDMNLRSPGGRCLSFDDCADGIGSGEGVAALLLKPLEAAKREGNTIHAIIKGSAMNQDGRSMGITAPDADSQKEVILKALETAGIDPETIGYFEAHGTGTKLGDPLEIKGISNAFKAHTERRQFCGIGSIKSNMGHLDHAAAMSGLFKLILSLKHKMLTPTLHFNIPNSQIDFTDSPLYVVDRLSRWEEAGKSRVRRCAISSFGLSGTNVHAILEEYPEEQVQNPPPFDLPYVFCLSAITIEALVRLVRKYLLFFKHNQMLPGDISFTTTAGRSHHTHRLVINFKNQKELSESLNDFLKNGENSVKARYAFFKVVPALKKEKKPFEITEEQQDILSREAEKITSGLRRRPPGQKEQDRLTGLYLQGARINWNRLFSGRQPRRISLPTYSFEQKRCWIDTTALNRTNSFLPAVDHPLFDHLVTESYDRTVYLTNFDVDAHWVLSEHIVDEKYIVPGTTFIEMALYLATRHLCTSRVHIKNIIFYKPIIVEKGRPREIQTIVKPEKAGFDFIISGKQCQSWETYAEGHVQPLASAAPRRKSGYNLEHYKRVEEQEISQKEISRVGPRWDSLTSACRSGHRVYGTFKLPARFEADLTEYMLHPALLDHCVNIANNIAGAITYLPFSYKNIKVYNELPGSFSAHLTAKHQGKMDQETVKYDIEISGSSGECLVEIEDYIIMHYDKSRKNISKGEHSFYHQNLAKITPESGGDISDENIIVINKGSANTIMSSFFEKLSGSNRVSFQDSNQQITGKADRIIFISTIPGTKAADDSAGLAASQEEGILHLFDLVKSLTFKKNKSPLTLNIISSGGYTGHPNPDACSVYGMAKVIARENSRLQVGCIDIDETTRPEELLKALPVTGSFSLIVLKDQACFTPELKRFTALETDPSFSLKPGGLYLISGGSGALALESASYLASKAPVTICLLGRTEPTDMTGPKKARLHRELEKIKAAGARAEYICTDVTDETALARTIKSAAGKYGPVKGVIHTAGLAGDGFIFRKSKETFKEVLNPKIYGTWLLDRYTREYKPDFFLLFSSVTALFAGMGQSDYTAANAWLDGFAHMRNSRGLRTISINWPAWKETGMAVDMGSKNDGLFKALTTQEGIYYLDAILHSTFRGTILPGTIRNNYPDLGAVPIALHKSLKMLKAPPSRAAGQRPDEVKITGIDGENNRETYQKVASIWGRVLGLKELDMYESFFDLGGDSILAVRLIKDIEAQFGSLIDVTDIFTYPTVSELSDYIIRAAGGEDAFAQKSGKNEDPPALEGDLEAILNKLAAGDITVEEAEEIY